MAITAVSLTELQAIHPTFEADAAQALQMETALENRANVGGTAQTALQAQLAAAKQIVEKAD